MFTTDQFSVLGTGPLEAWTAAYSLFFFLRHAQRNVASKGYFGEESGPYVMLYLHTAQILTVRPPTIYKRSRSHWVSSLELKPFYWGHPWLLRTQIVNSRSEVTLHSDTLPLTQDEAVVEDFITLRWKCGIHFGTEVSTVCTVYITTYWRNFFPKRPKVGDVAVSSNRHLSRR